MVILGKSMIGLPNGMVKSTALFLSVQGFPASLSAPSALHERDHRAISLVVFVETFHAAVKSVPKTQRGDIAKRASKQTRT